MAKGKHRNETNFGDVHGKTPAPVISAAEQDNLERKAFDLFEAFLDSRAHIEAVPIEGGGWRIRLRQG
jgi:hypothetical protein